MKKGENVLLVQGLGFLGVLLNLIIYWQKTRTKMLVNKLIANGVWAIHYYLLGAYSATAIAIIGMISTSVFVKVNPKNKKGKIFLAGFIIITTISTVLTWKSPLSLLTMAASILSNISFFIGVPKHTRRFAIVISLCMGTYGFCNGSIASVTNESLMIISAVAGIISRDLGEYSGKPAEQINKN